MLRERIYILYILKAVSMTRTTLFHSNRSQAVRLPKDVAFPKNVREVAILRDGARRVIVPANAVWDDFFGSPGINLGERDQPPPRAREAL
jgi:antitoxin VapB